MIERPATWPGPSPCPCPGPRRPEVRARRPGCRVPCRRARPPRQACSPCPGRPAGPCAGADPASVPSPACRTGARVGRRGLRGLRLYGRDGGLFDRSSLSEDFHRGQHRLHGHGNDGGRRGCRRRFALRRPQRRAAPEPGPARARRREAGARRARSGRLVATTVVDVPATATATALAAAPPGEQLLQRDEQQPRLRPLPISARRCLFAGAGSSRPVARVRRARKISVSTAACDSSSSSAISR
jgi:hypothetical protein